MAAAIPMDSAARRSRWERGIIAVTDSVEAMASHRPYRAAVGVDVALTHIESGRGTLFDAGVVDATVDLLRTTKIGLEPQ